MLQSPQFDAQLLQRYNRAGPRYTSYPTAPQFQISFTEEVYRRYASISNVELRPLSLYFHLPFCANVCYYCACNKIITKNRKRTQPYLRDVYRELKLQGELFDRSRQVKQLHWGGGTPTFLSAGEMTELMTETARHFSLLSDDSGEYSIEIDPREADAQTIALLRDLGFNRLSVGVQDFNPQVQRAVNRIQSESDTLAVLDAAEQFGFRSVNVDLIYGLPMQSAASFASTLDKIVAAAPQRIAVFNYAHMPRKFKTQRQIDSRMLPSPAEKLAILQCTVEQLTAAGYVYIGMDHFARPDDELSLAQRAGTLYRNFQGYSTHADCDLIALGITALSKIGDSYCQNVKSVDDYHRRLHQGRLPVYRGVELGADDLIRREIISRLMCDFYIDYGAIEAGFGIDFHRYFAPELQELQVMEEDGLLSRGDNGIQVNATGRLLVRNICMVFDRYLHGPSPPSYSQAI